MVKLAYGPPPSPPPPRDAVTPKVGEPYWLVWHVGGGPPTYKHASFDSADTEAKRLARIHQGEVFVVLETVRSHQVRSLVSIDLRPDRGLPF